MKKIILLLIVFTAAAFAQELKLYGTPAPANLMVGYAEGAQFAYLGGEELTINNDWFVFGFDRDDKGTHLLKVKLGDGKVVLKRFTLPERKYKIERINRMDESKVTPPKEVTDRIKREREMQKEAWAKLGIEDSAMFASGFMRPVTGGRISGVFGSQRILNGKPRNIHTGYDIAKPTGTPVHAMTDGIVRFAADDFYFAGNFILIDHGQGLSSVYLHLSKKDVKEGDYVKKGDKIGEIGTTGRSTGAHLHWSVSWSGRRIDPACLLEMNL